MWKIFKGKFSKDINIYKMKSFIICLAFIICCSISYESKIKIKSKDASITWKNFSISNNNILRGELQKADGKSYQTSEIDLTNLIVNSNGKLHFVEIGDYQKTCSECKVDKKLNLKCLCQDKNGKPITAQLNLGKSIINDNGNFSYVPPGSSIKMTASHHKA